MSHQCRSAIVVALAAVLLLALAGMGSACVGARALAMGGAFTGLADDVSATYWNPAALPYLEGKGATVMHVFNEDINYQDYFAYVMPLDLKSAFGLSYLKFQLLHLDVANGMYEPSLSASWNQNWYWLSYGLKVSDRTSLGANLKLIDDDLKVVVGGARLPVSADTDMAFDLAVYHHASDNVTVGLLVQNVNEPKTKLKGGDITIPVGEWGRNYRPGVAVRAPDGVIFAAELYDATDDGDLRALRVGVEKKYEEQRFALRAGRYAAGDASGLTLGAGLWSNTWSADVAFLGGDLDNTWVMSATAKF